MLRVGEIGLLGLHVVRYGYEGGVIVLLAYVGEFRQLGYHSAIWGVQEDLLVGCGALGYFVCSSWCGVDVRIDGSSSEGNVLGVPLPGLWFGGRGRGSDFLAGRRLIGIVRVYSCVSIGRVSIVVSATQAGFHFT